MFDVIKKYYSDFGNIENKLEKLARNSDIMDEFRYWIENHTYVTPGVEVEGYSAKSISKLSRYLDGEGAFMLLIELRENPDKAKKRIKDGFVMK